MGTYVVGDIHGCYDEWMMLKNKVEEQDENSRFILVGDIVDRGPKVAEMLSWAIKNITTDGKYQMVLGNHEDMKIQWAKQYALYEKDKDIFCNSQFYLEFDEARFGFQQFCAIQNFTDEKVLSIIEWFKTLPLCKEVLIDYGEKQIPFVICHANFDAICLNEDGRVKSELFYKNSDRLTHWSKEQFRMLWDRECFGHGWSHDTIVVHGHTPTLDCDLIDRGAYPGRIDFKKKDINVDCGACFSRYVGANLAAIRLEDLEEFYARPLEDMEYGESLRDEYKREMLLSICSPNH